MERTESINGKIEQVLSKFGFSFRRRGMSIMVPISEISLIYSMDINTSCEKLVDQIRNQPIVDYNEYYIHFAGISSNHCIIQSYYRRS